MAAALEETPISYEDLADIEREFDDVETEISTYLPSPPLQFLPSSLPSHETTLYEDTNN